ncbi:MAG: hypothetical protein U5L45_10980 [Saprospiraceae bacterium]|nr:hypothetical protein [Saprospiraceae bacterium]
MPFPYAKWMFYYGLPSFINIFSCLVAVALRQGASNVIKKNVAQTTPLHRFGQRLLHKGKSAAIVAVAGKMARIIWHMIREQQPFRHQPLEEYVAQVREQTVKKIQQKILKLNISAEELSIVV